MHLGGAFDGIDLLYTGSRTVGLVGEDFFPVGEQIAPGSQDQGHDETTQGQEPPVGMSPEEIRQFNQAQGDPLMEMDLATALEGVEGEGTLMAQVVSPLRVWEYLASKVITLTLLSLVENLLITGNIFLIFVSTIKDKKK